MFNKNTKLKKRIENKPYPEVKKFHHSTFVHAFEGFRWAFETQPNFKIEVFFTLLLFILNLCFMYLGVFTVRQLVTVFLLCCLVMGAELLNTSIEALSDEVSDGKYKDYIRIAKDTSAAGVFVVFLGTTVTGLLIYLGVLVDLIKLFSLIY